MRIAQTRLDEAIVDLQHSTQVDPAVAQAHYFLAFAELQQKQTRLAQSELESALKLQPDFLQARILLAGIKMDAGDLQASMLDLDRAVADKPGTLEPYIARASLESQQGGAARAEKDLLPLLDQFPQAKDRALTYRTLAWAMFNQKKYDAALRFLERSDQAQPDSLETFYLYGLTYLAEKKPDAALSLVQSRLRDKPQWAEGYAVGGHLAAMAGHNPQAETYFQKAIAIDPKLIAGWQGLGLVLSAESKIEPAINAFNNVLDLSPKSGISYFHIAQLQEKRGDWREAQNAYEKSLELDPDNVVAKNNLAWSYAEHDGNIDVALRLAQEANRAKPDDPEICDTLGWIYMKKNTLGDAIQVLRKSVALVPSNPEYKYHLGVADFRAGNKSDAKELLEAAIHLGLAPATGEDARKMLTSLK